MNGPKNNYMACLLNSRKIVTSAHGPVHMVSRGVRLSSSKEEIQGKSCTPEMARDQGRGVANARARPSRRARLPTRAIRQQNDNSANRSAVLFPFSIDSGCESVLHVRDFGPALAQYHP